MPLLQKMKTREGPPPLVIWHWLLVILAGVAAVLAPGGAGAEDLVVFPDGQTVRVQRAEVLPDRVRIETVTGSASELPRDVPAKPAEPKVVEVPRQAVRAVLPLVDLSKAAQPHAERYGDITSRWTEDVRRDLLRSWSPPPFPRR